MAIDLQGMSSMVLLDSFEQAVTERALLTYDDAPREELRSAQTNVDVHKEEVLRRMSW